MANQSHKTIRSPESKSGNKKIAYIVVAAVVVLGIILSIIFLRPGHQDPAPTPDPTLSAETETPDQPEAKAPIDPFGTAVTRYEVDLGVRDGGYGGYYNVLDVHNGVRGQGGTQPFYFPSSDRVIPQVTGENDLVVPVELVFRNTSTSTIDVTYVVEAAISDHRAELYADLHTLDSSWSQLQDGKRLAATLQNSVPGGDASDEQIVTEFYVIIRNYFPDNQLTGDVRIIAVAAENSSGKSYSLGTCVLKLVKIGNDVRFVPESADESTYHNIGQIREY
jgi:hypothetical protein